MKILIVDDDIYSVSALTGLLNHEHTLQISSTGADALDLFRKYHFDVILTDIRLP